MSLTQTILNRILGLDCQTVLVFVLVLLLTYVAISLFRGSNLPPGPWGLPFLGIGPHIAQQPTPFWQLAQGYSRKYKSDIISANLYGRLVIIINSHEIAKEAFQKRDDMADRPPISFFKSLDPDHQGILGSSGQMWKDHRRFALFMLRDFGMGKLTAETSIQDEAGKLCARISEIGPDKPFDPLLLLEPAVANIICAIAFGKRYDYDDQEFLNSLNGLNYMIQNFVSNYGNLRLSSLGFLATIFYPDKHKQMTDAFKTFDEFAVRVIKDHQANFDGSVNDMIDGYLAEQNKTKAPENFSEYQLRCLIRDIFLAGSETTTTTLRWAFLYLMKYQDIQKRIFEELEGVIGHDRLPNMGDRKVTPYTEAFLLEVQRYRTIVPLAVAHSPNGLDVQLRGYTIPAHAVIQSNLAAIHRDEKTFHDPEVFNPERFLDGDKVVNAENVCQFGIGRRVCAGEALARMEVYMFFVTLALNFKFTSPEKEVDILPLNGAIQGPHNYYMKAASRQH